MALSSDFQIAKALQLSSPEACELRFGNEFESDYADHCKSFDSAQKREILHGNLYLNNDGLLQWSLDHESDYHVPGSQSSHPHDEGPHLIQQRPN